MKADKINQEEYFKYISENGCQPPRKLWNKLAKNQTFHPNYYCMLCKDGKVESIYSCKADKWCNLYKNAGPEKFTIETEEKDAD